MIYYKDYLKIGKKYGLFMLERGYNAYLFYDKNDTTFYAAKYNSTFKKCWISYDIKYYEHNLYVPSNTKEIYTNEDLIKGIKNFLCECKKAKNEIGLAKINKDFE